MRAWEPMQSTPGLMPPDPKAYAFEPKWDGMRALVELDAGRLRLYSRNGIEQAFRFPEHVPMAAAYAARRMVLDGEIPPPSCGSKPTCRRRTPSACRRRGGRARDAMPNGWPST